MNNVDLLKAERKNRIRELIATRGQMTVPELSLLFEVSEATIRRDLEELDHEGWIHRTHGGAVRVERAAKEPPMMQRMQDQWTEKQRIGRAAAELVKSGETIFLGSGTTVLEIARNLPELDKLTVITNSLTIINELSQRPDIDVIVIGGMLRPTELTLVGYLAEQAIRDFFPDRVFMGMRAIDIQRGFTNEYMPEIMMDRTILSIGAQVVIVADHSKFGRVSSMLVAPVTAAHMVITDSGTPHEYLNSLRELGIEVLQV